MSGPPRRGGRRALGWAALAVAAAAIFLLLSDRPARFLVQEDPPGLSDAVVVLAGDPSYERTATAALLMRAGQARLLVLTGGEPGPGDSAASLRERAIALGVPPADIRVESRSRSTREALVAVAPLLREKGVRSVTLVTSPYHQRRAAAVARRAWPGIAVRSRPASPSFWTPRRWWTTAAGRRIVLTEYAKLAYYWARGWL
ncbi:MAG TPA: YdcF family protein [Vicinamibacteria bacterium]|nr:YdcF family protein [Vicinamibacteria bacterium]